VCVCVCVRVLVCDYPNSNFLSCFTAADLRENATVGVETTIPSHSELSLCAQVLVTSGTPSACLRICYVYGPWKSTHNPVTYLSVASRTIKRRTWSHIRACCEWYQIKFWFSSLVITFEYLIPSNKFFVLCLICLIWESTAFCKAFVHGHYTLLSQIQICTCMHSCPCKYMHTCMHTYKCTYKHAYICIWICAYVCTCINKCHWLVFLVLRHDNWDGMCWIARLGPWTAKRRSLSWVGGPVQDFCSKINYIIYLTIVFENTQTYLIYIRTITKHLSCTRMHLYFSTKYNPLLRTHS